ncbi:MAG: penicillin-binding protein activator LpoB [Granulosicoccus sp.]
MSKPLTIHTAHPHTRIATQLLRTLAISVMALGIVSCAATTRNIDPESGTHYDASYDFTDKKEIVDALTSSLMGSPQIRTQPDKPIVVIYGIANETSEHINTGGITDDIRLALLKSGQFRFINRKQRDNLVNEADYQYAGFVPPEQRINEGRQLGANYILSGTLRSIEKNQPKQWRLNKRKLVYYSMNLEITDLETGEISWADNVEIARESSKPIIGW